VTLLTDEERTRYQPFLSHYRRIRAAEGWQVTSAALAMLPYPPPDTPHVALWRRRASSFERLLTVLAVAGRGRSLDVLDLGAGCCWLSWQLVRRGHHVEALDVNADCYDGLGAASPRMARAFSRSIATMERLPYLDGQFDAVIAAASLHYAGDLAVAVTEAARVLRPGGIFILLDTPIYRHAAVGQAVVARRLAEQRLRYGSDGTATTGPAYIELAALRRAFRSVGFCYREVPIHGQARALAGKLRRTIISALPLTERAQMPLVIGERPC
jgi:ubiquinone/menaquinone biosynthesis C-methylase UbiE